MINWCKKVVLLAVLLVLPLQGMASALAVLLCHTEAPDQVVHMHDHGAIESSAHHSDHQHDGNAAGGHSDHFCHHLGFTLPAIGVTTVAPKLPRLISPVIPLHSLFVPEQPQRPPLA